jgi:phage terminase large subunit-like protein
LRHFTLAAGDSATLSVTATDSAGSALNLTGSTLEWVLSDGRQAQVTKTDSDGITVTNAAGGLFTVSLNPADTTSLPDGLYYHVATATDADDAVTTVLSGRVRLTRTSDEYSDLSDYQD